MLEEEVGAGEEERRLREEFSPVLPQQGHQGLLQGCREAHPSHSCCPHSATCQLGVWGTGNQVRMLLLRAHEGAIPGGWQDRVTPGVRGKEKAQNKEEKMQGRSDVLFNG